MKEATEMGGSDDEKDEWREWRGEREREREKERERQRESGGRTALDFNVCPGGCGQSPHGGLSTTNYFISIGLLHIFVI